MSAVYKDLPLTGVQPESLVELEEVSVEETKVNKVAVQLFNESYTQLTENIAFKDRVWMYFGIVPGVGFGVGACTILTSVIARDFNVLIGGGITVVTSLVIGGFSGIVRDCSVGSSERFVKTAEAITNFYNQFSDFKSSPQEYVIGRLFSDFESLNSEKFDAVQKDHHLIKDGELNLFEPVGKVLLMDAIAAILLEKNSSSPLAAAWKQAKEKNTTLEYSEFWKKLDVVEPTAEAYLEANQHRESLQLENFHDILKNQFETTLQRGLELKVL